MAPGQNCLTVAIASGGAGVPWNTGEQRVDLSGGVGRDRLSCEARASIAPTVPPCVCASLRARQMPMSGSWRSCVALKRHLGDHP